MIQGTAARTKVTAIILEAAGLLGRRFPAAPGAPGLGDTDQLNLVCGLGFRLQKALNHLATGSCGQLSFCCPLQRSQLRRKGMERDDGSWSGLHNLYTSVRLS